MSHMMTVRTKITNTELLKKTLEDCFELQVEQQNELLTVEQDSTQSLHTPLKFVLKNGTYELEHEWYDRNKSIVQRLNQRLEMEYEKTSTLAAIEEQYGLYSVQSIQETENGYKILVSVNEY